MTKQQIVTITINDNGIISISSKGGCNAAEVYLALQVESQRLLNLLSKAQGQPTFQIPAQLIRQMVGIT